MVRWVTYNLGVALIPLVFSVAIRWLSGKLGGDVIANSPEVLFFTLVVCATAMGDLSESTMTMLGNVFFSALLLGLITSAILYGCLLYDGIVGPSAASASFRLHLPSMSVTLAVVFFVLTTAVQIYLGRSESTL
jgi:hypothetical protein